MVYLGPKLQLGNKVDVQKVADVQHPKRLNPNDVMVIGIF
jgi:hypothetical protein